jgi:hypothetical protein
VNGCTSAPGYHPWCWCGQAGGRRLGHESEPANVACIRVLVLDLAVALLPRNKTSLGRPTAAAVKSISSESSSSCWHVRLVLLVGSCWSFFLLACSSRLAKGSAGRKWLTGTACHCWHSLLGCASGCGWSAHWAQRRGYPLGPMDGVPTVTGDWALGPTAPRQVLLTHWRFNQAEQGSQCTPSPMVT